MATYHCSVKVGGKGKASGHAAYIAREGSYAERAGYEDLEATGHGNLPAWPKANRSYSGPPPPGANGTIYRRPVELVGEEQPHADIMYSERTLDRP